MAILAEANSIKIKEAKDTINRLESGKTYLIMGTVKDHKLIIDLK